MLIVDCFEELYMPWILSPGVCGHLPGRQARSMSVGSGAAVFLRQPEPQAGYHALPSVRDVFQGILKVGRVIMIPVAMRGGM